MFPPIRTLIGIPYTATPSLVVGSSFNETYYPLSRLTDGQAKRHWRCATGTGAVQLTIDALRPCNFFGVFGHNFDHDLLCTLTNGTITRSFSTRDPSFWVDLRDLDGVPAFGPTWTFGFSGNSRPVSIGELAVGFGTEFEGILDPGFEEELTGRQDRARFEYGGLYLSATGTITRRMPLKLRFTAEDREELETIDADANATTAGKRVVVVPSSHTNDIWYVEWPSFRPTTVPASLREQTSDLVLIEEAMGVA